MKTAQFAIILLAVLGHFSNAQTAAKTSQKFSKQSVNQSKLNRMETQSMAVVKEFLNAVQTGNNEKLAAILHPDIQWAQPGTAVFQASSSQAEKFFKWSEPCLRPLPIHWL